MSNEMILECSIEDFRTNFNRKIASDKLTLKNLYKNHMENRFIGSFENNNFRLLYNISPLLINSFDFWTLNRLISPTILFGEIDVCSGGIKITYQFNKIWYVRFITGIFKFTTIISLIIYILNYENIDMPFIMFLYYMVFMVYGGFYFSHSPKCETEKLSKTLSSLPL